MGFRLILIFVWVCLLVRCAGRDFAIAGGALLEVSKETRFGLKRTSLGGLPFKGHGRRNALA